MLRLLARARRTFDLPWRDRLRGWQQDLNMVLGFDEPPPTIRRAATRSGSSALTGTRRLTVREVVHETSDSVSLYFERGVLEPWQPGEFLTLFVDVGGERLRRAYSLCTRPRDPRGPAITIKRVPSGRVSSHLVDTCTAGMRLEVRGPSGQFLLSPRGGPRHLLFIGGGSGITPLIALAEEALEGGDRVTLLYGNRDLASVIFRDRLSSLVDAGEGRFVLRHVLEEPPEGWQEGAGRLDRVLVLAELDRLGDGIDEVYSCGPIPMMDAVREALAERGFDPDALHEERFVTLARTRAPDLPTTSQRLAISIAGETRQVLARPGATILEAGLEAGLPMPHSCTMGGCGACRVRLDGAVVHDTPNGLTADELADGYAFACVARPLGPCSVEVPSR